MACHQHSAATTNASTASRILLQCDSVYLPIYNKQFFAIAFTANAVAFLLSFSTVEVYNFFVFFPLLPFALHRRRANAYKSFACCLGCNAYCLLEFIFEFIEWKQAINRIFNEQKFMKNLCQFKHWPPSLFLLTTICSLVCTCFVSIFIVLQEDSSSQAVCYFCVLENI